MSVTFTQLKNTMDLSEKVKIGSGEKVVKSDKIGKRKNVEFTITTKGGKFFAYFDSEKYAGSYKTSSEVEKIAKDYLKLVGEELQEVRKVDPADVDDDATDDDRKAADKNIMVQLRKVVTLRGMKPVTFDNGKKAKINPNDAKKMLSIYQGLKPASKLQLQKVLSKSPQDFAKAVKQLKENEVFDDDITEAKSATGYEIYHKDYSSAMKHATDFAKSKGQEIDPKEIDNKVATGPSKPSKGKENSFNLKTKKGKSWSVQVYNMGNKYELNMYLASSYHVTEAMKMNDPKLIKIFGKLKKNSKIKIKHDSTLEKGTDFISYTVVAKNIVGKGKSFEQEKITLKNNDNPTGMKKYLYNRDGKITMAAGDMAVSIADIREELEEGFSPKEIKMAIGVASDKRYAGGNMTGAVRAIEKIKKGLSNHKQVSAVLKRQNENTEIDESMMSRVHQMVNDGATAKEIAKELEKMRPTSKVDPKTIEKLIKGMKEVTEMKVQRNITFKNFTKLV
tara:strand:+ start:11215 stop:12729 length:1515 start_codon:yes stop_codon:yes gene_type:complete